jgi:hypothetical protein
MILFFAPNSYPNKGGPQEPWSCSPSLPVGRRHRTHSIISPNLRPIVLLDWTRRHEAVRQSRSLPLRGALAMDAIWTQLSQAGLSHTRSTSTETTSDQVLCASERAVSSAGEHCAYNAGVTGSIPVPPTPHSGRSSWVFYRADASDFFALNRLMTHT